MANSAQARKRARQQAKQRLHNRAQRSTMRTRIKLFQKSVESGDRTAAEAAYRDASSAIDSVAGKGLHHANKAARLKSRLNNQLRAMS